jgi:ABC-type antimicrobial peptide transport system ATPase subunit
MTKNTEYRPTKKDYKWVFDMRLLLAQDVARHSVRMHILDKLREIGLEDEQLKMLIAECVTSKKQRDLFNFLLSNLKN